MSEYQSPKILVVGLGGIGGIISAHALRAGYDVFGITTNAKILENLQTHGFRVKHKGQQWSQAAQLFDEYPKSEKFDYIFLATQPTQVEDAAKASASSLSERGVFVCFQNGLIESRLSRLYGEEKLVGGIIAWGASAEGPGLYRKTSDGGFTLGRLNRQADDAVRGLVPILQSIGPVKITDNLLGARWSKLAINCAISSLGTISGQNLGKLLRHRVARRLALEVMTETVSVARAEGIRLTKLAGTIDLNWLALTDRDDRALLKRDLFLKHLALTIVGAKYRKLRSSMLYAIERGREPAVDYLNGEVVQSGISAGISTPVNLAIVEYIHAIARKDKVSSIKSIYELFDTTRVLA